MPYKHGIFVQEQATSILPPVTVDAGIPMIVGTAPVGMVDEKNVNKPVLCHTYAEAVAAFGFVPAETDGSVRRYRYSICEAVYAAFALYGVAPIIIVNVLDPAKHRKDATATTVTIDATTGSAVISEPGVIESSVKLSKTDGDSTVTYTAGTEYELAYDDDGNLVISSLTGSDGAFLLPTGSALTFSAAVTDPGAVTAEDVIGGVNTSGEKSGWELIDDVFPKFRIVPGTLIAPGFSGDSAVAAVMAAKAASINGLFKAVSVVDVPTDEVRQYSNAPAWKNTKNIISTHQVTCWPCLSLDGTVYSFSSHLAPLMAKTDSQNNDVPYVSPSNQTLQCDATVLKDGTEVWMNNTTSSYLNGQGIVTAQNFIGGWVAWGNRTACYPSNTDTKDAFIPIRRMFNWIGNTIVETYWSSVDFPINRRGIERIVDSVNIWLNGLSARQYILGGRVEFLEDENPTTSLLDGIITFHLYVTPPAPAREINFVLEYDVNYLSTLFE